MSFTCWCCLRGHCDECWGTPCTHLPCAAEEDKTSEFDWRAA